MTPPPPGELIDLGGSRLHLDFQPHSAGGPSVVLEAGLAGHSSWWAWVKWGVSGFALVAAYDRAGLGWSEEAPGPRDAETVCAELRRLLEAARVPQPWILAGHSMGGLFVRKFAGMFPAETAGLVLLDASHPDLLERCPQARRSMNRFFALLRLSPFLARAGMISWTRGLGMLPETRGLPSEAQAAICHFLSFPRHLRTSSREARDWEATCGQVRGAAFPDLPLAVISPEHNRWPEEPELQSELGSLSRRATRLVLPGATHLTMLTEQAHAMKVVEAIRKMARGQ